MNRNKTERVLIMEQLEDKNNFQEGLIHTLESVPLYTMNNQFHRYMAIIKQQCGKRIFPGIGFSMDYHVARQYAVGEAIERYCAGIMNPADIVNQTMSELKYRSISPARFNRYTKEQYAAQHRFEEFEEKKERNWVLANNYMTEEKVYLPFETVYLLIPEHHKTFRDVVSTGLASGPCFDVAFENALNECIEKDAFMLFWLLKKVNYEISLDSLKTTRINKLIETVESLNYSIQIYDISQPDIKSFTILTVLKAKDSKGFYMAASTNRKLNKAIKKSIEEAISGYVTLQEKSDYQSETGDQTANEDSVYYYFQGHDDEALTEVLNPQGDMQELSSIEQEYTFTEMIHSVANQTDIFYKDLTSDDIKELNLKSLRVVTPSLLILPYEKEALLESSRLQKLANGAELNPKPHPYP
ncbi:Ribosomal protein S12 methylthiotransferase accessory factor OS=Ureibacillus acetophenoni OX=614649 GN=SAMN05877842_11545 PE=4 SV=1 [Ureibacillus acetophenoni]